MRFITSDQDISSLDDIHALMHSRQSSYQIRKSENVNGSVAEIFFGNELLGVLEINQPGDGLFDEEIEELIGFLEDAKADDSGQVEALLRNASTTYVVQVLWGDREADVTLDLLDVLWEVLFSQHRGLLQADGEGYYDSSGLVLGIK